MYQILVKNFYCRLQRNLGIKIIQDNIKICITFLAGPVSQDIFSIMCSLWLKKQCA